MTAERWLPLSGYEGIYDVSDLGRIRSLDRVTHRGRKWKGRTLSAASMPAGYQKVSLWRAGKQGSALVHRLVLLTFSGPCPDGMEGLHKDGNPANNALSNLAWGTHSENQMDQVLHGTHPNASKGTCPSGHPYNESNTYTYPGTRAHRACRVCRRENVRKWSAANPERARELAHQTAQRSRDKKKAN